MAVAQIFKELFRFKVAAGRIQDLDMFQEHCNGKPKISERH